MDSKQVTYEFLNHLCESPESIHDREELGKIRDRRISALKFRKNEPIYFGKGYFLSIQASEYHYCEPRVWLDDINEYVSYEIAIMNEYGFCKLSKVLDEPAFLDESDQVYGYVPKETVELIFQKLKSKYGLMAMVMEDVYEN